MSSFLVLGCGYTGERVARRLLARSERVHATARDPRRLANLAQLGAEMHGLEASDERSLRALGRVAGEAVGGLRVLCSVPPLREGDALRDLTARLLGALGERPERVVYLSTTSVYGDQSFVDERTAPAPLDEAGRLRLEAERAARDGPWTALVLRPAAIYGPCRGVHVALRAGMLGRVRDVDCVVSRVHVDDLAALAEAGLLGEATGAYPVADDEPATTREVAAYCERLGLPPLDTASSRGELQRREGRHVDGRAIRTLLGVPFRHLSYRTGIRAALEDERNMPCC